MSSLGQFEICAENLKLAEISQLKHAQSKVELYANVEQINRRSHIAGVHSIVEKWCAILIRFGGNDMPSLQRILAYIKKL